MRLFSGTPWDRPPECDRCGKLESDCQCPPPPPEYTPPEKQTARIAVENRARGKQVTVIRGLAADENDLPELLTKIKNSCGAGGTLKEDELEIQGRHVEAVRRVLEGIGYRVKG